MKLGEFKEYTFILICKSLTSNSNFSEFRLSYYPHQLTVFTNILKNIFGNPANHIIYGDFKSLDAVVDPAFYIHVVEKSK